MKLESLREIETVAVFKKSARAGTLSRTRGGALFEYDETFRRASLAEKSYGLAFTLSPENAAHEVTGVNLHPFFAGLLPEGLRLKALRQSLKTSEDDLFSMLLALGSDCIGDVFLRPAEHDEPAVSAESPAPADVPAPTALEDADFFELFELSIKDPDLSMREVDSGVPGVIPKISASMISFPLRLKKRSKEYLLKLGPPELPHLIENEHFFMRMAAGCGFDAAPTAVVRDRNGTLGLLVERFDRRYEKERKDFYRLHQEDACQMLGRYPQDKYRLSMREIAEGILSLCSSPLVDVRRLLDLYAFSYLVGNGDLHAKNISIRETEDGGFALSPVYDLLSTLPYGDRKMALKLGAKDENLRLREFLELGESLGVPPRATESSIRRLLERARRWGARFGEIGLPDKQTRDLARTFEERGRKLLD